MPKYFFDVEADVIRRDQEGVDMPDLASAYAFAEGMITVLQGKERGDPLNQVVIRGESGAVLARIVEPDRP